MVKISVIIPTYKPQSYLWKCLDSIKNQTLAKDEFEVILILNGCKEPYYSQIKEYISTHLQELNVNFIQVDQGGVSNARNIGLDNAKGEYITFIDDDDYISTVYLEELYERGKTGKTVVSNVLVFIDGENKIIDYPINDLYSNYKNENNVPIMKLRPYMSTVYAKIFAKKTIGYRRFNVKYKNGEDALFMFEISDCIKSFDLTSSNAIYYRRLREGSAISNNKNISYVLKNSFSLMCDYTKVYFSNFKSYSFLFYCTRILANFKNILISMKRFLGIIIL